MGQRREGNFAVREPQRGRMPLTASAAMADIFEKAPQEQASGQATPQVGEDLVRNIIADKSALQQDDVEPEMRMAADIFDSELAKSLALESSKTKYGPGQLSKSPGTGSYLGESSYPAGRTS